MVGRQGLKIVHNSRYCEPVVGLPLAGLIGEGAAT